MKLILNPSFDGYAIAPLQNREVESTKVGRLSVTSQARDLTKATLVLATGKYPAGTTMYLRGDSANQPWNGQIQTVEGKVFVLCPQSSVIAIWAG